MFDMNQAACNMHTSTSPVIYIYSTSIVYMWICSKEPASPPTHAVSETMFIE